MKISFSKIRNSHCILRDIPTGTVFRYPSNNGRLFIKTSSEDEVSYVDLLSGKLFKNMWEGLIVDVLDVDLVIHTK